MFVSNKINFSPEEAATPEALAERLETICDTFLIAEIDGTVADYIEGPVRAAATPCSANVSAFPVNKGTKAFFASFLSKPHFTSISAPT